MERKREQNIKSYKGNDCRSDVSPVNNSDSDHKDKITSERDSSFRAVKERKQSRGEERSS